MKSIRTNKGFTLIELLGTIIVLGVISSITIFSIINVINGTKDKSYKTTINNIKKEANNYIVEGISETKWITSLDDSSREYQCITVENLIDAGYFKSDILNSYVSDNNKVKITDNILVERNKANKNIILNSYGGNSEESFLVNHICRDYGVLGDIMIIYDNSWSRNKDIEIIYNIYNVDYHKDYRFEYNYVDNDLMLFENSGLIDNYQKNIMLSIVNNGTLYTSIKDNSGNNIFSQNLLIEKIDRVNPAGSIDSSNDVNSKQLVTLTVEDSQSGVDVYYFGKVDPGKYDKDIEWLKVNSSNLVTNVSSEGIYYLGIKDKVGNTAIYNVEFYKTELVVSNAILSVNKIITMKGNSVELPIPVVSESYYEFYGWYDNKSYTGNKITEYTPNSNKILFGLVDYTKYQINYDCGLGEGNAPSSQTIVYNDSFSILNNSGTCSKTGYIFDGWYDSTLVDWTGKSDIWKYENGSNGIENKILTLTAKWVDNTVPKLSVTNTIDGNSYNGSWTNKNVISELKFSDSGSGIKASSLSVSTDNSKWKKLSNKSTSTYTYTWEDEINKVVYFKICDNDNNCEVINFEIKIDKTKPAKPTYVANYDDNSEKYVSGSWTNKKVNTIISLEDNSSGVGSVQYSNDREIWNDFNNLNCNEKSCGYTYGWSLKNRNDSYYFRVIDKAGNVSDISLEFNIKYDISAPTIPNIKTMYNLLNSRNLSLNQITRSANTFTISGTKSTIMFNSIDNISGIIGSYIGLTSGSVSVSQIGFANDEDNLAINKINKINDNQMYATVFDRGWNQMGFQFSSSKGTSFIVDNMSVIASSNQWHNDYIYLLLSTTDEGDSGIASWQYSYSAGASIVSGDATSAWVKHANSSVDIYVPSAYSQNRNQYTYIRVCDNAGNCSASNKTMIMIDKVKPSKPTITVVDNNTFNYSSNDSSSGVNGYYVSTSNTKPTLSSAWLTTKTYDVSSNGKYYVWSKDNAGNISDSAVVEMNIEYAFEGNCNDLVYNGNAQKLVNGGKYVSYNITEGTNAGDYKIVANSNDNYVFSDGKTSKELKCSINKASGYITLDATGDNVNYGTPSKTFNISSSHGGSISVKDNNSTATVSYKNNVVTISSLSTLTYNTVVTVTVTSAETDNYTSASTKYSLKIVKSPTASVGTCNNLNYTGNTQTLVSGGSYVIYSNNSATNVGQYKVTATANDNYTFSDGTSSKELKCSIDKANGYVVLSANGTNVAYSTSSITFNISSSHGGTISVKDDHSTASTSISGKVVTVSGLNGIAVGTKIKVTVTSAETDNYTSGVANYEITIVAYSKKPSLTITNPYSSNKWYNAASRANNEQYVLTLSAIDYSGLGIDYYAYKTKERSDFIKYAECSGNTCVTTPWVQERLGETVTLRVCDKNGSCTDANTTIYLDVTSPTITCNNNNAAAYQTVKDLNRCNKNSLNISKPVVGDNKLPITTSTTDLCRANFYVKNCAGSFWVVSNVFNYSDNYKTKSPTRSTVYANDLGDSESEGRTLATKCNCIHGDCTGKITTTVSDYAGNSSSKVFTYYFRYDDYKTINCTR